MSTKTELINELKKLADEETDPLLKTWYTTTCSIVRDANEQQPGYDENAHRTLEATLKTLYPDTDTSEAGLEKVTFVGALASTANVVRKEILKMRELKRCKSQKTIDVIYNLFHPAVYGKDDEIVIETPTVKEEPKQIAEDPPKAIPVDPRTIMTGLHTRSIDWLARIDPSKYSIRTDGLVMNNHRGGQIVLTFMKDGCRCVKLKSGKHNVTMPIRKLMEKGFPEIACINQENQTIKLEAVTKPVEPIINTHVAPGPVASSVETPDDGIWIDWIDEIPKQKYRVYKSGRVTNICTGKDILPDSRDVIVLDNILTYDGKRRPGIIRKKFTAASLIWRAFHEESRSAAKLFIKYRDDNRKNIAIENLYI